MRIMGKNLEQTRYMISAASSYPPVLELLSRYGYGKERLQQGLALYEAAHAAMQAQRSATYVKIRGTTAFQEQWKEAKLHYQVDLSRARYVLRNNEEARNLLMLAGKRPAAFEAWYCATIRNGRQKLQAWGLLWNGSTRASNGCRRWKSCAHSEMRKMMVKLIQNASAMLRWRH